MKQGQSEIQKTKYSEAHPYNYAWKPAWQILLHNTAQETNKTALLLLNEYQFSKNQALIPYVRL